ncbi:hypothetical protein PR048_000214 [Dryococelus australis]|uniref:Uncharacterized protein n=1 Tax=Dryococelus australis TaxID=614101 RepID=A0ABQ9IEK9_9NEOP|nr:hypothetical protein PR048_000214 [Dryococelus australis]
MDNAASRRVFSGISRLPPPLNSGAAPYSPESPSPTNHLGEQCRCWRILSGPVKYGNAFSSRQQPIAIDKLLLGAYSIKFYPDSCACSVYCASLPTQPRPCQPPPSSGGWLKGALISEPPKLRLGARENKGASLTGQGGDKTDYPSGKGSRQAETSEAGFVYEFLQRGRGRGGLAARAIAIRRGNEPTGRRSFLWDLPFPSALAFRRCSVLTGSQDPDVNPFGPTLISEFKYFNHVIFLGCTALLVSACLANSEQLAVSLTILVLTIHIKDVDSITKVIDESDYVQKLMTAELEACTHPFNPQQSPLRAFQFKGFILWLRLEALEKKLQFTCIESWEKPTAKSPVLPHTWQYGVPYSFPCKSAIGSESSRACLINSDPIGMVTPIYACLASNIASAYRDRGLWFAPNHQQEFRILELRFRLPFGVGLEKLRIREFNDLQAKFYSRMYKYADINFSRRCHTPCRPTAENAEMKQRRELELYAPAKWRLCPANRCNVGSPTNVTSLSGNQVFRRTAQPIGSIPQHVVANQIRCPVMNCTLYRDVFAKYHCSYVHHVEAKFKGGNSVDKVSPHQESEWYDLRIVTGRRIGAVHSSVGWHHCCPFASPSNLLHIWSRALKYSALLPARQDVFRNSPALARLRSRRRTDTPTYPRTSCTPNHFCTYALLWLDGFKCHVPYASARVLEYFILIGATVAERLACSPPTNAIRVQSPAGHSEFSHVGIVPGDAAGRRVFSGLSCFTRPFIPALLHTHLNRPNRLSRPLKDILKEVLLVQGSSVVLRVLRANSKGHFENQAPVSIAFYWKGAGVVPWQFVLCNDGYSGTTERALVKVEVRERSILHGYGAVLDDILHVSMIEVNTEQRRNEGAGETGYHRENSPINRIVRHDSHLRKSGDPAGDRTRLALVSAHQKCRKELFMGREQGNGITLNDVKLLSVVLNHRVKTFQSLCGSDTVALHLRAFTAGPVHIKTS